MIPKGSWVQIHKIILTPEERTASLPEETRKVPLELWVKGTLLKNAELKSEVQIETLTGRIETGTLIQVNPSYQHNYGEFVKEILTIDKMVKDQLFGDRHE